MIKTSKVRVVPFLMLQLELQLAYDFLIILPLVDPHVLMEVPLLIILGHLRLQPRKQPPHLLNPLLQPLQFPNLLDTGLKRTLKLCVFRQHSIDALLEFIDDLFVEGVLLRVEVVFVVGGL